MPFCYDKSTPVNICKHQKGMKTMQIKLGEQIKALRRRDGRTQEDLANALGVTAQAVSRWEKGICYPDMELMPSMANYFGVAIDLLFGYDSGREQKINTLAEQITAKTERTTARTYAWMNASVWREKPSLNSPGTSV